MICMPVTTITTDATIEKIERAVRKIDKNHSWRTAQ